MSDWKASYAAYDDAALALIGNPGLVRRATKLAPNAQWSGESIKVGDFDVLLDGRGPAHGRCPCPTADVCVHVLAAAIFVREGVMKMSSCAKPQDLVSQEDGVSQSSIAQEDPRSRILAEILGLSPVMLCRKAGLSAAKVAFAAFAARSELKATGGAHHLDITWSANTVRYIAGAGWEGMVASGDKANRSALQLEALARLFKAHEAGWSWPEAIEAAIELTAGPTHVCRAITAEARREIENTVAAGLSHLGDDAADRLASLSINARVGGLPLLSRYLGTVAVAIDGLAAHIDEISESEAMAALAKAWGLCRALDGADEATWPRLRGAMRRDFAAEDGPLTLLPLGATWWTAPSGARGLTLTTWDAEAGIVRTATSARPAGTDPNFCRDNEMTALWGVPLSTLLRGPFRIEGPKLAANGSISATARSVSVLAGGFTDIALMDRLANELTPGRLSVGFADIDQPVALFAVTGPGEMTIDEVNQQVVWTLPVTGGSRQLRQEITAATSNRVDALISWQNDQSKLAYVLARRVIAHSRAVWEPASIFLRITGGLRMAALDFPSQSRVTLAGLLQKRLALIKQRWQNVKTPPPPPRSAVVRMTDDVRDIIVDLAATGRLVPSPEQRRRLNDLAGRCGDLALGTLARLLHNVATQPSSSAILRLQLIVDRVAMLATDENLSSFTGHANRSLSA